MLLTHTAKHSTWKTISNMRERSSTYHCMWFTCVKQQANKYTKATHPSVLRQTTMHATWCFCIHAWSLHMYADGCTCTKTRSCMHAHICMHRAECRGLLLACCSCAVACGPVCRADRWSFTASPGLSVEFTGRGRQFIRTQRRERERERGEQKREGTKRKGERDRGRGAEGVSVWKWKER